MPYSRTFWLLAAPCLILTAGCNYVHFGRIDPAVTDPVLAADNTNLRIEKKLLQEELAIARKEGDALRAALDAKPSPSGAGSEELIARLNETTKELATLRAGYARLQAERERLQSGPRSAADAGDTTAAKMAAAEQIADLKTRMGETEEKLAESLRNFTKLQEDNNRLRLAIDQAHTENATLTTKVEQITAQNNEARSALNQLNTEFLAQKEARAMAEQNAEALRSQLHAIADQSGAGAAGPAPSLASARESAATGAREIDATLALAQPAPDTAAPPTARLATSQEKLRAAAEKTPGAPPPPAPLPASKPVRTYVVRSGDTLEKISEQFYGRRDRWSLLYAANNSQLSGGRPLKPGMQLEIPEE